MIAPTLLVLDDNCESHGDSAWEFIAVPVPCCHIEPPDVVVVQERSGFFHTCWPGLFSISRMPLFGFELEDIFGSRLLSFRPLVGREVSILQARMSRTKVTFCSHTTSTLGLNSGWIVSIPSLHTARIEPSVLLAFSVLVTAPTDGTYPLQRKNSQIQPSASCLLRFAAALGLASTERCKCRTGRKQKSRAPRQGRSPSFSDLGFGLISWILASQTVAARL